VSPFPVVVLQELVFLITSRAFLPCIPSNFFSSLSPFSPLLLPSATKEEVKYIEALVGSKLLSFRVFFYFIPSFSWSRPPLSPISLYLKSESPSPLALLPFFSPQQSRLEAIPECVPFIESFEFRWAVLLSLRSVPSRFRLPSRLSL